jgi:SAM-dependent methyltransferase
MSDQDLMSTYDSQGEEYTRAFGVFLAHTDQKAKATAWLDCEVDALLNRDVFIDAGAGTGQLTARLQPRFGQTIAIEPNASLRDKLKLSCQGAEILPLSITASQPKTQADFALCSHVLYYIDRSLWAENLRCLASWLRPNGVLTVALQNHETDCMRMLRHFTGKEFDLQALARAFADELHGKFDVQIETVEAHVQTETLDSAYTIAEFMLNLFPLQNPPRRIELEQYVKNHFSKHGGYRFSCHQDFLRVQRKA